MGIFDRFKKMGNNCVKKHRQLPDDWVKDEKHKIAQPSKTSKKSGSFGHRRLGSTASTVSGDDIKLVWANSKDSSNLFDQLGAKDIFKRFNNFLESWKCWQDEERQCKEMLGFDLDMKLVESLCVIPSGMRLGLGCGSTTEDYDFYLDIDPIIQLSEISGYLSSTFQKAIDIFKSLAKQMKILIEQGGVICLDLSKILEYLEMSDGVSYKLPAGMQQLDNPEQLKEALMLVKSAVLLLKSYGSTITNYIMQQGYNVETVVSNKQSANPTLVIFPRKPITKMIVREMDEKTFMKLNQVQSQAGVSLKIDPSLVKNSQNVSVTWNGVENATAKDFIALYCPENAKDNEYIDYFCVDVSSTYTQGSGENSVQLTNFRTNCEMRYFRYISKDEQEFVARSNTVMFEGGPEEPLQIHLALTGNPSEMRVMWVSGTNETPLVTFSKDSKSRNGTVVKGTSETYKATDLCYLNGVFIDPGYIHDVLLTGLEPSTTYYYSCGMESHMSEVRPFKTAPPVGSNVSYKFIVYGDMGLSVPAHATAKYAMKDVMDGYAFIFHHGDISYARGYAYIWDQWQALIEPYSSLVPYMVGIGNHEQDHLDYSDKDLSGVTGNGWHPWWGNYGDDSNGECGVPMFYRFHMPDNGNYLWWYSYDYGLVHYIMMSTEHDMGNGSRQYSWLEQDLKSVDRTKTPWIILAGHRPMYTSELALGDVFVSLGMQHLFEDLLYKYHVDLAFWAHYHSYERTCAVYKKKCVQDGVTHITIGTAGKTEDTEPYMKEDWSLFQRKDNPYGYGRVMIANRSALHWEYFVNSEDRVVDEIWLTKTAAGSDPLF